MIHRLVDSGQLGDYVSGLGARQSRTVPTGYQRHLGPGGTACRSWAIWSTPGRAVSADGTALAGFDRENVAYVTVHFDTGFLALS